LAAAVKAADLQQGRSQRFQGSILIVRGTGVCYCHTREPTGKKPMPTSVLSVRVSEEERALLEAASEQARTSLSEFIRRKALDAAEADILERRIVIIPVKDWEAFEAWANRPPRKIAALRDLARKAPTWQK
jgi:uncharacterized protein (DUF1778 family)